jgi:glycosyltransferase involved in cell wall biosynthesis
VPLHLQRTWMNAQGPYAPALAEWLRAHAGEFDVIDFFTYLYWTTWAGLPAAAPHTTTLLHPCAHDEPPLYLPMYSELVRRADGIGTFVEEEAALLERRFHLKAPTAVHGIGIEFHSDTPRATAPTERPYLLSVGRVDPHKGSTELFDYFVTYKARNPGPLALVVVGDPVLPLDAHPDVISTGFVDEDTKRAAMLHSLALVHPSYFESFSLVLCEAWVERAPAVVQARCDVLVGQARRSGGAIPYSGFAEFEAAVDRIWSDAELRQRMGDAGHRYVKSNYQWDDVLDRYEAFVRSVLSRSDTV